MESPSQPGVPMLHANLGTALVDAGEFEEARQAYERALALDPAFSSALTGLGSLHVRAGRFAEARRCYQRVLAQDDADLTAHNAMYEIEQIDRNIPKALYHQRRVLERKALFSRYAPQEQRRLLALVTPGDWQANVPFDFLVDRRTTTVHKLYILSPQQSNSAAIPQADVVFTAIGESDENAQALALASDMLRRIGLPHINDPRKILAANRVNVSRILAQIPDLHAPVVERVPRKALEAGNPGVEYPLLVRPVGSQAGRDLARVSNARELAAYAKRVAGEAFYVMPFVDFRGGDGYYRKYRIIVVDGVPFPYHLAISADWMIHYYNTPMRETLWMREEEAHFLSHFEDVFPAPLQTALRSIAQATGLEYFGIDCSIERDGRLLVFEVDPAMVVHAGDDPQMFAYKIPHAQRIFDAFQALIDRVGSG